MTAKLEDKRTRRVAAEIRLIEVLNTKIKERRNTREDAVSPRSVLEAADRRRDEEIGQPYWCGEEVGTRRESGTENGVRKKKNKNKTREPTNRGQLMPREKHERTNTPGMGRIGTKQPKKSYNEANVADKREAWEASLT